MAELNYDYDTQNGQYSDGDIEERMLEMGTTPQFDESSGYLAPIRGPVW